MLIAIQRNVGCPELAEPEAEADPNALEAGVPLCGTGVELCTQPITIENLVQC
jgi:hypothetical protein